VTVDLDEAAARERLGFNFGALLAQSNALITRPEARVALVEAKTRRNGPTRSFVCCPRDRTEAGIGLPLPF